MLDVEVEGGGEEAGAMPFGHGAVSAKGVGKVEKKRAAHQGGVK